MVPYTYRSPRVRGLVFESTPYFLPLNMIMMTISFVPNKVPFLCMHRYRMGWCFLVHHE